MGQVEGDRDGGDGGRGGGVALHTLCHLPPTTTYLLSWWLRLLPAKYTVETEAETSTPFPAPVPASPVQPVSWGVRGGGLHL